MFLGICIMLKVDSVVLFKVFIHYETMTITGNVKVFSLFT